MSRPHTYMHLLPCLSRWQDASCTSKTSSFHSSAAGTWSFGTLVHNNISVVQLKPTKKYLQRLLVPLTFATAKSALHSVGSPAHPKMLAAVANRWAETESKVPSSPGMVKANDDGACLRLAHAQVENEIQARPRRAPRRGARGHRTSEDCARSPYGESTFKRNRPSFAVLMVLGGGSENQIWFSNLSHFYVHLGTLPSSIPSLPFFCILIHCPFTIWRSHLATKRHILCLRARKLKKNGCDVARCCMELHAWNGAPVEKLLILPLFAAEPVSSFAPCCLHLKEESSTGLQLQKI